MVTLIAIAGGSASGKTTIARALAAQLDHAAVIGDDDYYRPLAPGADPDTHNFDAPDAKDLALLAAHLAEARAGRAFAKPVYDLRAHSRLPEPETIAPHACVIVEGLHAFATPALAAAFDLKVFIEAEEALRLGRRMIRDVSERARTPGSVLRQFLINVRPMHADTVAPQRALADLVLVSTFDGGHAEIAAQADLIRARLEDRR
jgi:uridine kinase